MTTRKFKIISIHDIYEDNYKKGEKDFCHSYIMEGIIETPNGLGDAICIYFSDILFYAYNESYKDVYDNRISYSVLVDVHNNEVLRDTYLHKEWVKGNNILYSNHIDVVIEEIISINVELELKGI